MWCLWLLGLCVFFLCWGGLKDYVSQCYADESLIPPSSDTFAELAGLNRYFFPSSLRGVRAHVS